MPIATKERKIIARKMKAPPPQKKGGAIWLVFLFIFVFALILFAMFARQEDPGETETAGGDEAILAPWIEPRLIEIDGASRRGEKLEAVRNLAVHYVGNPGTSAEANRNWFNDPASETSAHFIVGLEGEILQCIPLDEKSSATNHRNSDTISIEVCHPDETGEFSEITRNSLIRLLAFLCERFQLTEEDLIRHYDVTGKKCPLYYVENEDEWLRLKSDVKRALEGEILWEE